MWIIETVDCSRCGGCGEYSWNAMTGSRCFKCNGSGKQETAAGADARKRYNEIARPEILASEVAVGTKLRITGSVYEVVEAPAPSTHPGRIAVRTNSTTFHVPPDTVWNLAKTPESHRAAWDAIRGTRGTVEVPDKVEAV